MVSTVPTRIVFTHNCSIRHTHPDNSHTYASIGYDNGGLCPMYLPPAYNKLVLAKDIEKRITHREVVHTGKSR